MLERFKKAVAEAKANKQSEFCFEGHEFVTRYAEYLIEFLETKL